MAEEALLLPFSLNPQTGKIVTTTDQNVIWSNRVRIAIETSLGERVMRPTYGTKVPNALFNTIDAFEEEIKREVNKVFVDQLPLLTLVNISTTHDAGLNRLAVEITYQLPNKNELTTKAGVMVVSDINPPFEELL